jgi:hypothetical protein
MERVDTTMHDGRRIFDCEFVSVLTLMLLFLYFFGEGWLQVTVLILAVAHSIWTNKNRVAHIHLACGVHVLLGSAFIMFYENGEMLSIYAATMYVIIVKISTRIIDIHSEQRTDVINANTFNL